MRWKNPIKYGLLALMFIPIFFSLNDQSAIPYFVKKYHIATSRSTLEQINEHLERGLPIFITHLGKPTYLFYTKLYDSKIEIPSATVELGVWNSNLTKRAVEWKKSGMKKIWVYDSHTFGKKREKLMREINAIGETELLIGDELGSGYLVRLK